MTLKTISIDRICLTNDYVIVEKAISVLLPASHDKSEPQTYATCQYEHGADTARQDMQNTGLHPVASTIPEAVKMEFAAVTETDGGRRDAAIKHHCGHQQLLKLSVEESTDSTPPRITAVWRDGPSKHGSVLF